MTADTPHGLTEAEIYGLREAVDADECCTCHEDNDTSHLFGVARRIKADAYAAGLAAGAATHDDRLRGVNEALGDLLRYYAERRPMGNPKGWDHVLRRFDAAVEVYGLTDEQANEVRRVLAVLDDLAAATNGAEA